MRASVVARVYLVAKHPTAQESEYSEAAAAAFDSVESRAEQHSFVARLCRTGR